MKKTGLCQDERAAVAAAIAESEWIEAADVIDLPEIIQRIKQLHNELIGRMRVTLGCAVELGDLLNEAKKMVPHGEFQTWCEANTNYSARRCQEFIKLSKSAELRAFDPASAVHVAVKALSGISTREPAEPQPWTIDDGINKTREAVARLLKRWPPEHIVTFANQLESLASEVRTKGKLPL